MSVDYYMVCPKCKATAQIFRFTASGYNPPNGLKVHDFFLSHSGHDGFMTAVHEGDSILDQASDENWTEHETYGEGREALPVPRDDK